MRFKYWLILIIIVLLGIDICFHISPCTITDTSIVLTFIGILATFVVISNYAQVLSIEKKFNDEVKQIKLENKTNLEAMQKEKYKLEGLIYMQKADSIKTMFNMRLHYYIIALKWFKKYDFDSQEYKDCRALVLALVTENPKFEPGGNELKEPLISGILDNLKEINDGNLKSIEEFLTELRNKLNQTPNT
jgi:hypothetical protein